MHHGWPRVMVITAIVALVASCGGGASSPASPAASGAAPRVTDGATTSAAASSAPAWLPSAPQSFQEAADWEDALVDRFVATSGLEAELGREGWAFVEAEMRSVLSDTLERNGVAVRPGRVASSAADLPLTAAGGVAALGLVSAMIMVSHTLANPNSPLSNIDANVTGDPVERTVDGVRTVSRMSGRIASSLGNGRVTGTVGYGIDIEQFDAVTGQSLGRMTFSLTGTIELDICPDADGKVKGTVSMALSGGIPAAGTTRLDIDADIVGLVNDAAFLASIESTGTTTDDTTSPSGSRRTSSTSGVINGPVRNGALDLGASTGNLMVDSQTGEPPLTQAEADERYARIGTAIYLAASMLGDDAQEQWRGGACVEIQSSETGRTVRPNERVPFEAKPFHKIDQVELSKPIAVSFAGEASVDPVDATMPSPVTLLYVASSQRDRSGTVSLKSTSNRGIGTLDVTFRTVIEGWKVDGGNANGRVQGQHCGDPPGEWVVDGTYDVMGMRGTQRWVITIDATGVAGTYTYQQVSRGKPGGGPVTVTVQGDASGTVTLTIDEETGNAQMHFKELQHTYTASAGQGTGAAQPVPLEESDLEWEPDPTC